MTKSNRESKNIFNVRLGSFELILLNDDYHHFDFVIEKLKQHCSHSPEQAEQSALIAHHKGECSILIGNEEHISKIRKKLEFEGLIVDTRKVTV